MQSVERRLGGWQPRCVHYSESKARKIYVKNLIVRVT